MANLYFDRVDDGIEQELRSLLLESIENLSKQELIFVREIIYRDERVSTNRMDVINETRFSIHDHLLIEIPPRPCSRIFFFLLICM